MKPTAKAELEEVSPPAGTARPPVQQQINLPKIIPFKLLCKCGDEVWIENEGTIYRLQKTRLGKLILTK